MWRGQLKNEYSAATETFKIVLTCQGIPFAEVTCRIATVRRSVIQPKSRERYHRNVRLTPVNEEGRDVRDDAEVAGDAFGRRNCEASGERLRTHSQEGERVSRLLSHGLRRRGRRHHQRFRHSRKCSRIKRESCCLCEVQTRRSGG